MSVKTYRLVEVDEPHPLVARALNADLWTRCRIENPVPVHFVPMPRWGGLCPDISDTVEGEIQLSESLLSPEKKERGMADGLTDVYLHELSHRLTPGHDHDAAFFAVNALLFLRAGKNSNDHPFLHGLSLYDLHEWHDVPNSQPGQALDWALNVASELAGQEISAEAAAVEILARYEKWKAWKTAEPARVAKTQAARAAEVDLIHELRGDRWRWAFAALFMGFTLAAALFINK